LLRVTLEDPYSNLALEEALFVSMRGPSLRIWGNQKSVVIGRAQLARFETNLRYCLRNSVPIVRRFTAGGTVYNGPGNLNWSFFMPGSDLAKESLKADDARHVFSSFAGFVTGALASCGVSCKFQAPNSIVDGRGKISGLAAYISRGGVLCHGTLLIDADLVEVDRCTRPSRKRIAARYPRSRFVGVSNCGVEPGRFVAALCRQAGFVLSEGALRPEEVETYSTLLPKYRSEAWNLGDPFELDYL
jgi:lipoate-protein ligase A